MFPRQSLPVRENLTTLGEHLAPLSVGVEGTLVHVSGYVASHSRVVVLEPSTAKVTVLFQNGKIDVWYLLGQQDAGGDSRKTSADYSDLQLAVVINGMLPDLEVGWVRIC